MNILLLNPAHPAIGSRIPTEHLPPLGLLSIGGPLLDAGHSVTLLDADLVNLSLEQTIGAIIESSPDVLFIGHSGSMSGHPVAMCIARALRLRMPRIRIIYGGVFPTYHWQQILETEPSIDVIVRGEGEDTAVRLAAALEQGGDLALVPGIAYREPAAVCTTPAPVIRNLDDYRIAWELIDHRKYSYYGKRRAVVVQFSRGCPHQCSYCGQHYFWRHWRHRDPVKFAAELARLHREQGVQVVNFADENPTANRGIWKQFLEAIIRENVPLIMIGSTRAGDIVRDADLLHLYRRAGFARFLLGIESTDESTLRAIHKGSTPPIDKLAIQLLRKHGIISMAAWVAGFKDETDADYLGTLKQLLSYDPDQVQSLYATPHAWTPLARDLGDQRVIQTDLARWDYKHQVLSSKHVPNWRVLLWVKFIEAACQCRPKALHRLLFHPDPLFRSGMRWYSSIGKRVWIYEILQWLLFDNRTPSGPALREFHRFPYHPPSAAPKNQKPGSATASAAAVERTVRLRIPATRERTPGRPFATALWSGHVIVISNLLSNNLQAQPAAAVNQAARLTLHPHPVLLAPSGASALTAERAEHPQLAERHQNTHDRADEAE